MPKVSNKKIPLYNLDNTSVSEQAETNTGHGTSLPEIASSGFSETIKAIIAPKSPLLDILPSLVMPKLPIYEVPQVDSYDFKRHDPPVTIKKSKWEKDKEKREAYRTELQIQLLEAQLAVAKGSQVPQYDISTGTINFMGKTIAIPLNTKMEMVCRVVLKNLSNMKRKWSWDEIIEANRENPEIFTSRQIYNAVRKINDKVAIETQFKNFLLAKPFNTVQLNPEFLPK